MSLLRSIATIGSLTMVSRVLGLVRDILIANIVDKAITDAFFVAFKFPNLFRRLFAEGAFNAAYVPQFAKRLTGQGRQAALVFADQVASVMTSWLLVFTISSVVAMPLLMYGIAYGFTDEPDKFALTVELSRITFPYLLFMALTAMLAGTLNSVGRFAAAAAAPIVLNIVLISSLLLLTAGVLTLPGHALAWAVAIAGAGQLAWVAAACGRHGVMLHLPRPRLSPDVRRLFRIMVPAVMGYGVVQINMLIDMFLATLLPEGSVSYLFYADRLNQLPLGVIGVSVGVALLPTMTRQLRAGATEAAADSQNRGIEIALVLAVPATAALIVIADPIISVIYQRGRFTPGMTDATAAALMAFAVGLPAYVMQRALTPGFFAREDTMTPVKIAIVVVVANVALAVVLMQFLQHVGIALATGLTAWLNAGLLGYVLHRRGYLVIDRRLKRRLPRIIVSTLAMAGAVWWAADRMAAQLAGPWWLQIPALAALVGLGAALYLGLAHVTGAARLGELKTAFRK